MQEGAKVIMVVLQFDTFGSQEIRKGDVDRGGTWDFVRILGTQTDTVVLCLP